LSLDYETSSPLDLTEVGAYRYAKSAKIMCAAYSIYEEGKFDREQVKCWRVWKGDDLPDDLHMALMDPDVKKCAWNAQFERLITTHCLRGDTVPLEEWYCTAARARASAYPGKLDLCAKALGLDVQKDLAGAKVMKKLATTGEGTEEEFERMMEYCVQDVIVEATIGMVVRDLTEVEWTDYWVCEAMNDRGIPVDVELARAAQKYAEAEAVEIKRELAEVTNGEITSPKQFKRIKGWLGRKAPELAEEFTNDEGKLSLDRSTRTAIFEGDYDLPEDVLDVLHLIDDAGRASTAKYAALENRTDTDGRLRGAYLFNGAGQTGRFSAVGFQPHNLVRDKLDNAADVAELMLDGAPPEQVMEVSKQNMLTTLARMLRPTIVAEIGKILVWADYSSVEARVLPWLSDNPAAEDLLDIFRRGDDVYKHAAAGIYRVNIGDVDKDQRQMGKIAILALGYQGGKNAFRHMARAYGLKIDDETAEDIKVKWRLANPWAGGFWRELETAAIAAVNHPGTVKAAGRLSYLMHGDTLFCLLPCGRLIAYPEAAVQIVEGKFGPQASLTALKASMHPKKGKTEWPRVNLYGGILAENADQGFSASLLRAGARALDDADWPVVMHTHDEIVLEVFEDEADDAEAALRAAMVTKKYPGLPLAVEVQRGYVYSK
jgi:DNA polymerase